MTKKFISIQCENNQFRIRYIMSTFSARRNSDASSPLSPFYGTYLKLFDPELSPKNKQYVLLASVTLSYPLR